MIDLALFRFSYPLQIRFADLDVLEHVNNAKYFTYMESARLAYFQQVIGWSGERSKLGVILARATCDFKLPLTLGDQIRVCVRVPRIGTKSFEFEYAIVREHDSEAVATGTTVQVAYDYVSNTSIEVPEEWQAKILAYEPGLRAEADRIATSAVDLRK